MKRPFIFLVALSFMAVAPHFTSYHSVGIAQHDTRGRIAFVGGFYEGPKNIYALDLDDHSITQLTVSGNNDYPDWSPDGCQIAFTHREMTSDLIELANIFVMNSDGTNEIQFTHDGGTHPVWSPDGTKIAYLRFVEGNGAIYIAHVDGSQTIQLTDYDIRDFAWSPDGQWIAFISNRDNPHYDIYAIDVNEALQGNSIPINLTNSLGICPADYYSLSWSPTEERLAFSSACEVGRNIYVMDLQSNENGIAGLSQHNLTESNLRDGLSGLDWSPDGTQLVFVVQNSMTENDVYIAAVDKIIEEEWDPYGFKLLDGEESRFIHSSPAWEPQGCNH